MKKGFTMASPAVDFARSNQQRFLNELKDLLRIPSVSTLEEHKPDIQKAADYVANELRRIGMENVELIPTKGHPLLYADWLHAPGKPTVLMYAHFDVQPPDPLDEWKSPPFEPTERNNNIYARGAVDDKGQLWMEVKALEALMQTGGGKLPLNVKIIFEGEEEVGGESIAEYIRKTHFKTSMGEWSYGANGEWTKSGIMQVQYHDIKDGETWKGMNYQTVLTPPELKTGNVIYPYEKAK